MYPCGSFPKNTIPVDILVSPMRWGRRGVEYFLVFLGTSSWRSLNRGRALGSCLVTSVLRKAFHWDMPMFMHAAFQRALLLGNGVDKKIRE